MKFFRFRFFPTRKKYRSFPRLVQKKRTLSSQKNNKEKSTGGVLSRSTFRYKEKEGYEKDYKVFFHVQRYRYDVAVLQQNNQTFLKYSIKEYLQASI
jgi:hypothetical protein